MCIPSQYLIRNEYDFNVSRYRTFGEVFYGDNLAQSDTGHLETATQVAMESGILCWARPIIPAELKFIRLSETQAALPEQIRFQRNVVPDTGI